IAATALAVLLARPALAQLADALRHMRRAGLLAHPKPALHAAWPHLLRAWLLWLPLAPALAVVLDLIGPRSIDAKQAAAERRAERARRGRLRRARRLATASPEPAWPPGTLHAAPRLDRAAGRSAAHR